MPFRTKTVFDIVHRTTNQVAVFIGLPEMDGQGYFGEFGAHAQGCGNPHPEDSTRSADGNSACYTGNISGADGRCQSRTDRLERCHGTVRGIALAEDASDGHADCVREFADLQKVQELLTSSDTQITASAYLNADQAPSKAVDGDKTTQWNAMMTNTEPNTLTIDLLAKQSVSAVELLFYQPWIRSYKFKIEVSADGYEWITVANYVENGVGYTVGEAYDEGERITFTAQTARYIRFVGYGSTLNNGTQNTYNPVREFRVYGTGPKSLTLTASAENEHGGTTASYAVDGIIGKLEDTTTDSRWSAMMITDTRPENKITFDLGEEKKISAVAISFYLGNARSYNFDIEVSSKGDTWTKVLENKDSGAKVDKEYEAFEFEETTARYVRYIGRGATELSGGAHNNYSSFWEFRVYGYDNE